MQRKTMCFADDGTPFETEEACLAYERNLERGANVDRFLASDMNHYKGAAHASIARRSILDYFAFLDAAFESFLESEPLAGGTTYSLDDAQPDAAAQAQSAAVVAHASNPSDDDSVPASAEVSIGIADVLAAEAENNQPKRSRKSKGEEVVG